MKDEIKKLIAIKKGLDTQNSYHSKGGEQWVGFYEMISREIGKVIKDLRNKKTP